MKKHNTFKLTDFFTRGTDFYTHIVENNLVEYHNHNFYEVFYIQSGEVKHTLNGYVSNLKAGHMVILKKSDVHTISFYEGVISRRRDMVFGEDIFIRACNFISPSLLDDINNSKYPLTVLLNNQQIYNIEELIMNIQLSVDNTAECNKFVNLLLVQILEVIIQKIGVAGNGPAWLNELVSALNEIPNLSLDINDIISRYNYDKAYIRRMFKKYMGITITDYKLNIQLNYAVVLLRTADINIKKIADICGFNNTTYFYRAFKNKYGLTPNKFKHTNSTVS